MSVFAKNTNLSSTHSNQSNDNGKDSFFGIQAKLNIGKSNDKYEVEADRVADQVVSNKQTSTNESFFNSSPIVQKKATTEDQKQEDKDAEIQEKKLSESITPVVQLKEDTIRNEKQIAPKPGIQAKKEDEVQAKDEEELQSKEDEKEPQMSANADANPNVDIENNLNNSKGSGASLSGPIKNEMESGFGSDFSNVKIHNDETAVQMNKELGSQAFASGNDIYFNEGKYNPNSTDGKHLLAHELTHTVQQGASPIQPKMIQKTVTAVSLTAPSTIPTSLQTPTFNPSEKVASQIERAGSRGADVNVTFGSWASGAIKVKKNSDETYSTKDARQSINLNISYLNPLQNANITPVLAIQIENSAINGYITVKVGDRLVGNPAGLINAIRDNSETFGWVGIDVTSIPNVQNTIEGGHLQLTANGIPVELGGFVHGSLDFGIQGDSITFRAEGRIEIPRLEPAQIIIEKNEDGNLTGEIDVAVNIANFNGSIHAAFLNGTFDIRGIVVYQTDKISGQVTLLVTDAATARNAALSQLDPSQIDESARETNGVPEANSGPTPGPRALAGWGEVDFSFTEWMTGRAMVIIDNEGHVTIHGEITPPAEVELFPQRDYIREIFTIEVRTLYGVPLVGNVFLFANIGLEALAKIGPAKIYNIRAVGTYSTDPAVFNDFTLSASFNMSMFAGLRLRAEGGLGVELLGHDIKVGVGINALAGIRGYVDATPTIGYRETSSPEAGRQGEFFIHGHAEMAAQPFLALGGDLFVELDSPWWSPVPDDKWTWPLGELDYPLPGEFGIGADVDYVLGSDELPEIEFAPVDFNSDKFMTDLMNDHVAPAQSNDAEHPGEFNEGVTGSEGSETPQVVDSTGNPNAGETGSPPGAEIPEHSPTPEVLAHWGDGLQAIQVIALASENNPLSQAQIAAQLNPIRTRHHFTHLTATRHGQDWNIIAEMPNINNRTNPITVKAINVVGDEENGEVNNVVENKQTLINEGLNDLRTTQSHFLDNGRITREEAENVASQIRQRHNVFTSFVVIDDNESWDYRYTASPAVLVNGAPKDLNTPLQIWIGQTVRTSNTILSAFRTAAETAGYNFFGNNDDIRRSRGTIGTNSAYHIDADGKLLEGLKVGVSLPTHTNFIPQTITISEENGIYTATYGTINNADGESIQNFTVSLSFTEIMDDLSNIVRHQVIQGGNLALNSTGRGRGTWDSTDRGFHNAHLIADRFGGSGQNEGFNIYPSSPNYNVSTMKTIENSIAGLDQVKESRFKMKVDATIKEENPANLRKLLADEIEHDQPKNFIRVEDENSINHQEDLAISRLRDPILKDLREVPGQFISVDYKINGNDAGEIGVDEGYKNIIDDTIENN